MKRYVRSIPEEQLSSAESRWAEVAIRTAIDRLVRRRGYSYHDAKPLRVIVIDEPEVALHRAAERHMAKGLAELTLFGEQLVVATHSPEILNQPQASLIHVRRGDDDVTQVSQLDVDLTASVAELGLLPSDLLGMYRVFLLVEGEHDKIVLESLIPESLRGSRVKVIAMRGGSKLPGTVESQIMFDMTTAQVVALLDNVRAEHVSEVWQEAQERHLSGGANEAIEFVATSLRPRGKHEQELVWIAEWLTRALRSNVASRVTPFGLGARDIIEYLPVEQLVPSAGMTWDELRAAHAAAATADPTLRDFKAWLSKRFNADTSPAAVRRAAEQMTSVPEELTRLAYRLREFSTREG